MKKALLRALLMPMDMLRSAENALDFTTRLMITEEFKDMPFGAVWGEFTAREELPNGRALIDALDRYQERVAGRG